MNSLVYALGARIFSDVLPTHLAQAFDHHSDGELIRTNINPGSGSSPSLKCTLRCGQDHRLTQGFASVFGSWAKAVEFLSCQEAALTHVEDNDRLAFAEIRLPIDLSQVRPAEPIETPECSLLPVLSAVEGPLCFVVPQVPFRVLSERLL